MRNPSTILITGASSGIGAALAEHYAANGVTLFLSGRDKNRLESVAAACSASGATVHIEAVDVADPSAMETWINACDDAAPLELVIANAGVSATTGNDGLESSAEIRTNFAINLDGVLNTALPAIERMAPRGRGQVALMSSVMGFRGFPNGASYSASKGAVRIFGEGLRGTWANRGIEVSVILPAMVKTPMTDALAYNRGAIPAPRAAEIISRGLEKDKPRIGFTRGTYFMMWLLGGLPSMLTDKIFRAKAPEA